MSEPRGTEPPEPEATTQRLPVVEKSQTGTGDDRSAPAAGNGTPPVPESDGGREGRFWSARRVPAGIVALLLLGLAGLFLYDIVSVRADRPVMSWRRELARQLAGRPLDDTWVLVGAGVAAALGLWLLVLAATPGLRHVLPMRRTHADVRAGLDRDAAATALRDRAMEVAGVQSVRVRVRRRRADARAVSHFRELDEVRTDLDAVLTDAIRGLGLSRPPSLSVRVRRPGRKE
ncbi:MULTISPECIES: DUF6286 domain-containing protein [Streptomyces]|uniref:DUF6286 domain-containing protein n=1 Tax=Streptomyces chartreusis NRRL 3882 TaxID=1079985 RepID=A0A2N9BHD5_STRCX|nr:MULTISPECIES: DUF6286 domain-containing protein [Streptomyces]MYS89247.1 hypothetical protein [Streptomyces sp. SID5464]SOR82780.1 hypothetical protein SCNRRL3882_6229 [Streptomyces chartreusis NRRL 3882]